MEHAFNVTIATQFDIDTALFLQHLKHWTFKNLANKNHIHDGFCWTYDTLEAFHDIFPYWTKRQMERVITNALKAGLIIKGNYNTTGYDRTCWYALTYKSYWFFPELANEKYLKLLYLSISPNGEMSGNHHFTEWGNQFPRSVTPIPYTIPDTKKKTPIVPLGTDTFNDFWNIYPRKKGKEHALKWFRKNKPNDEFVAMLIADITKRLESEWKGKDLEFIPHPSTYLNGKRWEDDIVTPACADKPRPSKIITEIAPEVHYSNFVNELNSMKKLKLIPVTTPTPTFENWVINGFMSDTGAYIKSLNT